ncbi:MAG: hypothetical protein QF441_10995 [Bacteriovoracaceae bacterium]|nr:hypothetical protein [Bacteriovoracaceae bacterium]
MKLFVLGLLLTITQLANAQKANCKLIVIEAYDSLNITISEDGFSSLSFEELNMSIDEFNSLDTATQEELYQKLMPLQTAILHAINALTATINRYSGPMYEAYFGDQVLTWHQNRQRLQKCLE